jgi:hypothetical protein
MEQIHAALLPLRWGELVSEGRDRVNGVRHEPLTAAARVLVPKQVIEDTLYALQLFGKRELEGLVLWLGEIREQHAVVLRSLVPPQRPVSSEGGLGYFVDGDTLFALNQALSEAGLRLIAQVHSHPTEAYHSDTDDRYAIVTADGGLSLVVPNFGDAPADPAGWAVYRLTDGDWLELSDAESRRLFVCSE